MRWHVALDARALTLIREMARTRLPRAPSADQAANRPIAAFGQSGQYALRAMVRIGSLKAGETITGVELADSTGVPPHYLSKILRKLVEGGLLRSQRGPQGGFCLARPARLIRFANILDAVGAEFESNRCAFGWGKCNLRAPCPLHPAFVKLNCLLEAWRDETTLADVCDDQDVCDD